MAYMIGVGGSVLPVKKIMVGTGSAAVEAQKLMVGTGPAAVEAWSNGLTLAETVMSANTAGGSTSAATLPPNRQVGDLMVLIVSVYNGTLTTPSGWTRFATDSGTRNRVHAIWRICDGTESSTLSITVGQNDSTVYGAMLFRNAHPTSPINVSDNGGLTIASTSHTCPAVTTTSLAVAGKAIVVRVACTYVDAGDPANYTWPGGQTEVADYQANTAGDSTQTVMGIAVALAGAVGSQGTVVATSAENQRWGTLTFVVSPKP
ncbi:hypothetical protein P3H15_32490 [Rhodococcus sp. T2V]|uniref:hypothetical protein n=1 Tax=Rhodococcus sp. T2V TaxID=3034164 RepID=UPI0023E10391|nr:hypothetical protein [Rhodococcus sp. T2V]MDF3309738.1 hypothetical protein [Rhodococcus sp. T2V]